MLLTISNLNCVQFNVLQICVLSFTVLLNKENSDSAKHTVSFSLDPTRETKPKVENTGFGLSKPNDKTGLTYNPWTKNENNFGVGFSFS